MANFHFRLHATSAPPCTLEVTSQQFEFTKHLLQSAVMSAYASEWPPPSPAALLPPQQQQQQQSSPVTDDRLRNTSNESGSSSGEGEEKKQSEGDIHMATTPPRRQRKVPPKDEAMGGTSNGTAARTDGTSIGAEATTFASGPSAAAISGSTVESKPEAAVATTGAGIGGRLHEEEEETNNDYPGNGIPSVQASMSSDSLVRVSALSSMHADTPPPPPGDEQKLSQLSPRERLVERLPHRPAPAGVVLPEGAVEAINLLPRDQLTPQRRQVAASPAAAAASLNGLSVPSPPTGGGPFASPSRQLGVMVPSASGVGFAPQQQQLQQQGMMSGSGLVGWSQPPPPGRRCIRLRLMEEAHVATNTSSFSASAGGESTLRGGLRSSILNSFRKKPKHRGRTMSDAGPDRVGLAPSPLGIPEKQESSGSIGSAAVLARQIDRGVIIVSWYDGTGSSELNEHVLRSVRRKLGLAEGITLRDVRIIDESVEPSEEIVLCPYIPDGSMFLLKFSLRDDKAAEQKRQEDQEEERRRRAYQTIDSYISEAPESPSAAPSPHPSTLDLVKLQHILTTSGLVAPAASPARDKVLVAAKGNKGPAIPPLGGTPQKDQAPAILNDGELEKTVTFKSPIKSPEERKAAEGEGEGKVSGDSTKGEGAKVQDVLRQLTELLGVDGGESDGHHRRRRHRDGSEERKQVVFVLANYFVLFLSLIVISAEIHERAPRWMDWVTTHVDSVQSCSKGSDALYKCVSEGNLAGLVASIIFWVTRSAATKNILLFGFDSPQKLWTVVYEALVSALCWGTSYMFIRRGLNPDTRPRFLHKYWKDAIYGSLAGFNAAFLKAVLKNLIPQDQVLDAVQTRHSVVVGWLSHIFHSADETDF